LSTNHDQLNVTGTVSLGNATLNLSPLGFTPSAGQTFVIVNNDGADSITGNFILGTGGTDENGGSLAEGDTITNFLGSALEATITYQGGMDTNDVVLTAVTPVITPGNLQFSAANYNDTELNSGTHLVTITVQRVDGTDGAVSVHWATSAGTASPGSDYTESSGDVSWIAGNADPQTFTVTVSGDTAYELNETVNLTLSAPTGGAGVGTPNPATLTIINDDIADTDVALSGGNLQITDVNGANTDDTLVIRLNGSNVRISDSNHTLNCGAGTTAIDANICEVLLASITGLIQVDALAGSDSLVLDLGGGNFFPPGGVTYNGGDPTTGPGDKLFITNGSQGTVTYHYTNAHDGSIAMSNIGTVSYTGLEPITNTGDATNIIFELPAGPNAVTLADEGTGGNTMSQLSGTTLENTTFANPTASLMIKRGNAADTVAVNALPDFDASLAIGSAGSEFSTITFTGAITLAANNGLAANASTVDLSNGSNPLTTSGTGTISLTAANVSGAGNVSTGGGLTISNTGSSSTLSGVIAGPGGLTKLGAGTLVLSGTNTYGGVTLINGGRLDVNGSITSNTTVNPTGTLGGTGTINSANTVTVSGGTVAPGTSAGILNTGNVSFDSSSSFAVEIGGITPGTNHDQLNVTGTVSLGNATLNLSPISFTPSVGQTFVIINNDSADAVTGTFNGLPEGTVIPNFLGSTSSASITYVGGSNLNNVVLTVVEPEMDVEGGSPLVSIADSDNTPSTADATDFGSVGIGNSLSHTFTILNTGTAPLNLTGTPKVVVTGSSDFVVTTQPGSPLAAVGGSTTFVVQYTPSALGAATATISIANDDTDENPYDFALSGNGIDPCQTLIVNVTGDEPDATPDGICETAAGNGFCTLRAAIMESNASSCAPLTINFSLLPGSEPQQILLEDLLPAITRSVTIQGPLGQMVSVDGDDSNRIFEVASGITVNISNLIITNGFSTSDGAGLVNNGGTVNISNCVFTGNQTSAANGAAIANNAGTLSVWNSTFSLNQTTSSGNGGAIYVNSGIVTLTNNTISENGAADNAGGVYNNAGTVNVRNTIIAGNLSSGSFDVQGTFISQGHNLISIGDGSTGFVDGTNGDHVGTEVAPVFAELGPFDDHGGTTLTYSLLPTSPALEGGDNCVLSGCSSASPTITTDQRNVTRPQSAKVDIGAYEMDTSVVNTTADHAPGLCEPLGPPGADCTLREAINAANASTNPSQIAFDIPTGGSDPGCVGGVCTIALDSVQGALPEITQPVMIDGYSQTGAMPNTQNLSVGDNATLTIVLSGFASPGLIGLDLCAGSTSSAVKGLVINNFPGSGIQLENDGLNLIAGNFIGTDATAMNAVANGNGIAVVLGVFNIIGGEDPAARNIISGNTGDGVQISGPNTGINAVEGNYIGTKKDGDSALSNNIGVNMFMFTGSNTIGCETENGDNVISGNTTAGIRINESDSNTIEGNLIGTDKAGVHAIPNGVGVDISDASDNAVGFFGYGSVISGNTGAGVQIKTTGSSSYPSSGNLVYSNKIGTNAAGTDDIPNDTGILIQDSSINDIGSGDPADRNLISGNTHEGVRLENANGTFVFGNFIGTDVTGSAAIPNAVGVEVDGGSANEIGCTVPGSTNVISGNTGDGVEITGPANENFVQNNLIGVQADGTSALGNGGVGVEVYSGAHDNVIGVEPPLVFIGDRPSPDAAQPKSRTAAAAQPRTAPAGGGCSKRATVNNQNTQAFKAAQQLKARAAKAVQNSAQFLSRAALNGRAMKDVVAAATSTKAKASGNAGTRSLTGAKVQGIPGKGPAPSIVSISGVNVIANNGKDGVRVSSTGDFGNLISQNEIFSNGALGINLGPDGDGVTPNNSAGHTGPNLYQNFPLINFANPGDQNINFSIDGTGGTQPFTIEFFVNSACDGTNGEGKKFIGSTIVNSGGPYTFVPPIPFANGEVITATATDAGGNTSEFSVCKLAGPPAVSIDSVTLGEGQSGTTVFTFNVTLSSPTSQVVTVQYATQDGTTNPATGGTCGTVGVDYATSSGTVTFNPGETTMPVTISVCGDTFIESDETFFVNLSNPVNATIANVQGTGTILNDDCPTTFEVNNSGDTPDFSPGDGFCGDVNQNCTLRAAIDEANALTNCGTISITFNIGSVTINVGSQLTIDHNVNIIGPTANSVSINGNSLTRLFGVNFSRTASISNLTLTGGKDSGVDGGGAILNNGTLTLNAVTLNGNSANNGGAISSDGALILTNTTISGNRANGDGGGLYQVANPATLTNVTIADNRSDYDNNASGTGGGVFRAGGNVLLHNTIVADNYQGPTSTTTADNIGGSVDALSSYNVIGAGTGGLLNTNNNQVGVATALLGALMNNGGPTFTHGLLYNSPAVDSGDGAVLNSPLFISVDQRSLPRPADGDLTPGTQVDIGAYERQATETRPVPVGSSVLVDINDARVTFPCVPAGGCGAVNREAGQSGNGIAPAIALPELSLSDVDPATQPAPPPGYVIGNGSSPALPAFNLSTAGVTYDTPVTVCFYLPSITDGTFFNGLRIFHNNGSSLDLLANQTTNFANRLVCGEVNSFSPFVIGHTVTPTAADGSVTGQILDNTGNPVEGAAVRMNGTQNRLTVTDAAGRYHFDEVETNGLYVVTPSRPNFTFSPPQRSFSQLGANTEATFTAVAGGGTLNPLDTTEYFVRQQYLDFLGREPDEAGFNFWVNNIQSCNNNAGCREAKRIDTSAAFFLSIEFQQTGYVVYRTYQAAYSDLPNAPVPLQLTEFRSDAAQISKGVVVLQNGWQRTLETNKKVFAEDFVKRARFAAEYPLTMTPTEFVDKLFANAAIPLTDDDHAAAIGEFARAADSSDVAARGRALRRVAENSTLTRRRFNRAFVLMEYFGYLRRDPNSGQDRDFAGYNFWLDKLDRFDGNFQEAEMVKAFLSSIEYRARFPR
jgi:CSLREA domain-containing protein